LPGRITLGFVQGAGATLGQLADRDEVALALVWLRHLARTSPGLPAVEAALRAMLENPHLTARQRIGAEIWRAHVLQKTRDPVGAAAQLRRTLIAAAEEGSVAILSEERAFLTDLLAPRRLREAMEQIEPVRRLLRHLAESGPGRTAAADAAGLTRQEARVLHAVAEGATNKQAANLLGLSEATVKFHLANLYRKLGCQTRSEAVRAAQALRLVA
jgi:DNA-binding CsgD family transcriptional regulator